MKFLILNGPNINLARWSEPGVPGEVDYTGLMDYVQAGCDQLGIETDICQSNHEGDFDRRDPVRPGAGGRHRAEPRRLRSLQRSHSGRAAAVQRARRRGDAGRPGRARALPQDGRGVLWLSGPFHRAKARRATCTPASGWRSCCAPTAPVKAHIVM